MLQPHHKLILGQIKVQISKMFEHKIVIIFLTLRSNMCFGCSKEPSPTHNICFGQEIRKIFFNYTYLEAYEEQVKQN